MDVLEILYDHYKETCILSKEAQVRRNKNFILLCVLEAISFLLLIRPEKAFDIIRGGINKELNLTLEISNTIMQTLLWLLIVYIMIRYIQDMLYIERQYKYIENLEKKIASYTSTDLFAREGDSYQSNYPMVLNFIDLFYKMLMPILFAIINVVRIWNEWMLIDTVTISIMCDTILFLAILIIDWFYFFEIHCKITDFCKRYIPFLDKVAQILRKMLKEV